VEETTDRHAWERPGTHRVAPGVHRIPLPLPGDGLRAVNVYALEQPGGEVVLVDSGWAIAGAREQLEAGLAELDRDLGQVARVLVTHVHRDHYELGMHLKRLFGARLALGIGEQPSLESMRATHELSPTMRRLQQAGAAPLVHRLVRLRQERAQRGELPEIDWILPDEWLRDGTPVELADRTLQVVATPGHTQGHVVFVDEVAGVMFTGDHVLPHITPSIGFEALPVDRALVDYLASLTLVRGLPDRRMLPAHGPVRPTTHDRIDQLLAHHDDRLAQTARAVDAGNATAHDVAAALPWTRRARSFEDLDPFNQMLAVNETMAHLEVLVRRDRLAATDTGDGPAAVREYRPV
jgi:glyoxylase-like metal-dependent hydrolase (beta-lactamase superfamily II)